MFRANWIDTDGNVKYDLMELKTVEYLKVMCRTYHRRITKGAIEFDVRITKSVDDIIKMLKCTKSPGSVYIFLFIIILLSYVIVCLSYVSFCQILS